MTISLELPPSQPVQIRVFLSSTFQDMQAERESLARWTFPYLQRMCENRGASFSVVDLRWGITDEQSRAGKVLEICLEQVDRCRPFFVGILGQRYGWRPGPIPADLRQVYPWLAPCEERSITELEIMHGVLRKEVLQPHRVPALFYFRDSTAVSGIGVPEDPEARRRLADLKARICQHPLCEVREGYTDAAQFAAMLRQDLENVIDKLAPLETAGDQVGAESAVHWHYAVAQTRPYLGHQRTWRTLDHCLLERLAAILITGEEGSGKTALLCHWFVNRFGNVPAPTLLMDGWILRRTSGSPSAPQSETGIKWLYHFVGASEDSHSTLRLVRRWTQLLFWDLKRDRPVPETPREARVAFLGALREIAERDKVVLLIDGIDQLIAEDPVLRNLYWLPLTEHPNIRLIATCRPGPAAQSLKQPFQSLELRALRSWERSRLVEHLLYEDQTRRLPRRLVSQIAKSAVGAAPRRLTALCEELNAVGKHETLATQIEHYLEQPGETEFYLQVFNRLIAQYQAGEEGLVREMLTLIAVSRLGLNETELQGISPQIRDAASNLDWASTLSAVSHLLTRHGPQWQLPEGAIVNAVYRRWMPCPSGQAARRLRLVDYFMEQPVSPRMIDELPWQLVLVGRFSELESRLRDLAFLVPAWQRRASDVRMYWGELKRHTGQSVQTAYRHLLDDPNLGPQEAWVICRLLQATGFASTALDFGRAALAFPEFAHSQDALLAYGVVVELASQLGAWEAAEQAFVDYDKLARQWGDAVLSVRGGLLRGGILRMRGDSAKAVSMLQQVAQDLMAVNDVYSAAAAMGIAGQALFDLNHYQQALVHFENQLRYGEQLGDIDLIRNGISNRNGVLIVLSRYAEALSGIKREQQICETLGDRQGLADCLSNRAVALLEMAQYDDAMHTLDEVERLYTELCNPLGVAQTRLRQAYLFGIKLGQRRYALPIALEGCELAHQSGDALLEDRFQRLLAELTNH